MDAVSDPRVSEVVVMSGSQLGKTELLLNIVGFHIAHDPAPILVVQPTLEMASAWSKDRLANMLRDSPCLRDKVADPRSRDSGNTTLHKVFPGGHITIVGSNSPASMASRPIRIVLVDELDRCALSAGAEGDPVALARRRSATFWNRKVIQVSSPTLKGFSRIEDAYKRSSRNKYFIPCHSCGEMQDLEWKQVRWEENQPETAKYHCRKCDKPWTDADRIKALSSGEWRAEEKVPGVEGFMLSGLYSPWSMIAEASREFVIAKQSPLTLQGFVNTYLCETWEEAKGQDEIPYEYLFARREDSFSDQELVAPEGCAVITCGIDVQDDRLELEFVAWGKGQSAPENWSLHYGVLYGDPSGQKLWDELDSLLLRSWNLPNGRAIGVSATCIDSGGHYTSAVYAFVKGRPGRRIYAIKDRGEEGRPPIPNRPSRNNIGKIPLYVLGSFALKEQVIAQLRIEDFGPGYCHFPDTRPREYFLGLLAEKIVTKWGKGYAKRSWQKTNRQRNEPLVCRVYALASLMILNVRNIDKLAIRMNESEDGIDETDSPMELPRKKTRPRRNFANRWQ